MVLVPHIYLITNPQIIIEISVVSVIFFACLSLLHENMQHEHELDLQTPAGMNKYSSSESKDCNNTIHLKIQSHVDTKH